MAESTGEGTPDDRSRSEEEPRATPEESAAHPSDSLRSRRRWVLAVAAASVALTVAGVLAAGMVRSPAQAAAEAGPPPPDVLTAQVEYRVLTSSVITRGEVTAEQTLQVKPQIAAGESGVAPVVTRLPVRPGDSLKNGRVLMEVSGRPVIVLEGKLPAYRDLRPGTSGDDVRQLQRALTALGHPTGTDPKGTFGPGTKAALTALYEGIGYEPLPAQGDGGESLESARDAVTDAERVLEDARETGGSDGSSPQPDKAVRRAAEDLARARADLAEAQAAAGPMLPAGEVVYLDRFPGRVDAVRGRVGSEAAEVSLTVSAGRLLVQAYLPEYQKGLVRPGQKVEIHSEISGVTAAAKVASVADSRSAPEQMDGETAPAPEETGYLVEVVPDEPLDGGLTGQDVRLTIEAASTGKKALVVPITALSSGADGRTVVTVVGGSGAQRRVEVRPGTAGDGFVAVTPIGAGRLGEGDRVVTGVGRSDTAVGGADRPGGAPR